MSVCHIILLGLLLYGVGHILATIHIRTIVVCICNHMLFSVIFCIQMVEHHSDDCFI